MKINLQNYESFLLDYTENNLNPIIRRQVENFLAQHPELMEEMQSISTEFPRVGNQGRFRSKSTLIRSLDDIGAVTESNFEEHCIAFYEGGLSEKRKRELEDFVAEAEHRRKLFTLHGKLHFVPDSQIKYEGKSRLRKSRIILLPRIGVGIAAVAAAIVLGVFIYNSRLQPVVDTDLRIAENKNQETTKEEKPDTKPDEKNEKPKEKSSVEKKADQLQPVILAKFDTTNTRTQDKVKLAALEPRLETIPNELAETNIRITLPAPKEEVIVKEDVKPIIEKKESEPANHLLSRSKDQLILEAVSIGIKGFNNLTENNLALSTEQDEAGNVESFKLETERFEIKRKIRKNM